MSDKGKSINALMRHIREDHHITIKGSLDKQHLLNMGYYHGYKAFRFVKERSNTLKFETFREIKAIHDFDNSMKSILYPLLMSLETSIKNRLIDYLVDGSSSSLEDIYRTKLTGYLEYPDKKYKDYLVRRLALRTKIDGTIARHYGNGNPVVNHFMRNSKAIPFWAFCELISLGELGNIFSALKKDDRIGFTKSIGINHDGFNQNGRILETIIYILTDLRNSVMHNSIIFDCRFNNGKNSGQLKQYLNAQLTMNGIEFNTIVDFYILIIYLLLNMNFSKTQLKSSVRSFNQTKEALFELIPQDCYFQIMGSDSKVKINKLLNFISKT